MRYSALLLIALLALATCKLSFLSKNFDISDSSDDNEPIDQFFEGFFDYYNLSRPSQILNCFCDKSASIFFDTLYEKYEVLKDSTERASLQLHIDYAKLSLLYKALESTNACAFLTQDITDLLDALNIKKRDPSKFGMALYLNYQAHYDDLYEAYQPLIDNLNAKNFTEAGRVYGDILNYTVTTIRKEGSSLQAFNGFGNGFSIQLDIDEPSDSLDCYDNDTSSVSLNFIYKLSVAVTDGKFYEAPVNTLNFWEKEGKDILSKLPKDVMDCDSQSNDHQLVSNKLGIDIYTEEFGDLMKRYINNHRLSYYGYLKGIRSSFEDHNFIHAGEAYAELISAIASKKTDESA